ncbi:MAG TPA: CotH kinase family protein, partial [Candidatus Acidoferrum sp.]|nr:CotH kinase family protein [Candidatus Acidoferrum sp.]
RTTDFIDTAWLSGPAELGFGDGGEATLNTAGFVTYYYRHSFNVPVASAITNLRVNLKVDDGAVIYLNGVEAYRRNMDTGVVTSATSAPGTAADDGSGFHPKSISAGMLQSGPNVLAVEVHQAGAASSDVSFDLELIGNPTPSITISGPTNNQVIASTSVGVSGVAVPAGLNVTLVEVFAGATKVGESTNDNFNVFWQNVVPGNYALTAKLTDSAGMVATSAPVSITVQAPPATLLVPRGSLWRYNNQGVDIGLNWTNRVYDETGWGGPSVAPIGDNVEGGVQQCATVVGIGTAPRYPVIYFRKTFTASSVASYSQLFLRIQADDSAAVYLNGHLLQSDGVLSPGVFGYEGGQTRAGVDEVMYREFSVSATALVNGTNVIAAENHQVNSTSSDIQFDVELEGVLDVTPPIASYSPSQGSTVLELSFINVGFSEGVTGVNASDLLINGEGATSVVSNNVNDYTFHFTPPPTGTVSVAWVADHGIADSRANTFAGGNFSYTFDPNAGGANVIISEFVADNDNGIRDDDSQRNDWIELRNLGPLDANLDGWFLTDTHTNLTKWRIPAVALANANYVLIWASSKDKTNLNAPLHTNFRLQNDAGGYVALVNAQTNIVSVFSNYPAQPNDIGYGRDSVDPNFVGYLSPPTPAAQNAQGGAGVLGAPILTVPSGVYTNASVTLVMVNTNGTGTIRYTTDASSPTTTSPVYSSPLVISANSTIKARVFPSAGGVLPSRVVARNYIFLDATSGNFTSKLPTMIISTEGRGIPANVPPGQARAQGSVAVFDTQGGRSKFSTATDMHELGAFEISGQTSAGFPKVPFRIELQDADGNDVDTKILGMPADSDWRLRNPYNDKTEMNDFLGYELWEKMGHYSVRRQFVELFLDTGGGRVTYPGDYYGIMVLCETIKVNNDRVDIPSISPYATNLPVTASGFIFKRDKDSGGDLNFVTPGGPGFAGIPLKLHEPKPNDMRTAQFQGVTTSFPGNGYTVAGSNQMAYLRNFLGTMERMMYTNDWTTRTGTNHYSYYLDPIAFADQMIHVELTKQIDGYRLSDFFTKGNDGRIGPGPVWDWNLAFGNA